MTVSVIIPTLNEEAALATTLQRARQPGVREIIVVDGGSTDTTRARAAALADLVFSAPCSRAVQMNAAAARASGDILLFLHADTWLPAGFADAVTAACAAPGVIGGRFDVQLEPSTPLLWLTGELINIRSRLSHIATGDQAIFIRRPVFEQLGGYADIPLMEDIDLTRRMKRAGRPSGKRRCRPRQNDRRRRFPRQVSRGAIALFPERPTPRPAPPVPSAGRRAPPAAAPLAAPADRAAGRCRACIRRGACG
jgi:rSAM/selenodomain-associated transferase 2